MLSSSLSWRVSAHHTGYCQPFGCQFTIREFAFTAKAVTHAAGKSSFFHQSLISGGFYLLVTGSAVYAFEQNDDAVAVLA